MKSFYIACALMFGAMGTVAVPDVYAQVNQADADVNIIPDKLKKIDNGVRISVCLIGIPHTSQQINSVDLVVGNTKVAANDIDGVDFERMFQFEDMGVVTVDIDFPFTGNVAKGSKLIFHTEKGDIEAPAVQ